jgi:hypothetical protein
MGVSIADRGTGFSLVDPRLMPDLTSRFVRSPRVRAGLYPMLVCPFLITLSRPVYAQQRSSTARPTADAGIPQQVLVDTSGRLYGASKVPRVRGNSLGVIDSATIAASAATTLSDLLAAHVAGVSVLRSSGVAGSGSRMRLRGGEQLLWRSRTDPRG